jgi:hypothetical protein
MGAGLRERGYETGLVGRTSPASEQVRTGSLLVLCAWAAFMVAGGSLDKMAEHFPQAVPRRTRALSVETFGTVEVVAIVAGLLVVAGAVMALPAFVAFLRGGGWVSIRRPMARAGVVTAVTIGAGAALAAVAHTSPRASATAPTRCTRWPSSGLPCCVSPRWPCGRRWP